MARSSSPQLLAPILLPVKDVFHNIMADRFDFNSFKKELTSVKDSLTSAIKKLPPVQETSNIVVLSWNVNGEDPVKARNLMVPKIVGDINPDVLLLQEVKSKKMVHYIASTCSIRWNRSYEYVESEKEDEAKVLYDPKMFAKPLPSEQIEPKKGMKLKSYVKEVSEATKELRSGDIVPDVDVYEKRVAAVSLEHKRTENQIIFMSFHNRKPTHEDTKRLAETFLQIVLTIADKENKLVVVGADFNCKQSTGPGPPCIPNYDATARRLHKKKIDYFVIAGPGNETPNASVVAYDIIPRESTGSSLAYSREEYNDCLDHDPLVCTLSNVGGNTI